MNRNTQNSIKRTVRTMTLLVGLAATLWRADVAYALYFPYSQANGAWNSAATWNPGNPAGSTPPSTLNDYALILGNKTVTFADGDTFSINGCAIGHANITGVGTLNMTGGSLQLSGFNVGESRGGTFNQSGGSLTVASVVVGANYCFNNERFAWNLSGSANAAITGDLKIGLLQDTALNKYGGPSTVTLGSGTTMTIGGNLLIGGATTIRNYGAAFTHAYNLNGGILTVNGTISNNPQGTKNFTFNGGTLKAGNTQATFMSGLTHAYVSTNGAVIDSNGKNIGISQALEHAGAVTDGGLTKLGTGTLTLSATNTYNGATTVSNGTLIVNGSVTGVVNVFGGTLGGTGTVAGVVTNLATITAADTNSMGTLTVSNLVMAANSTYVWNYNGSTQDLINVTGTLTLPTVATVNVSQVISGTMPNPAVLFTFTTGAGAAAVNGTLGSWVINGAQPGTQVSVLNGQVIMGLPRATLISFF